MKLFKRIAAIVLAATLILAMGIPAMAGETPATDGKITVTSPAGIASDANNIYSLYKVFDAETDGKNYAYKRTGSHTDVPAGFVLDDAGNVFFASTTAVEGSEPFKVMIGGVATPLWNKKELTQADIDAIATYIASDTAIATKTVTGPQKPVVFDGLTYGYYFVTTTTGSLVVIDSTKPAVAVDDKNTVPGLDKKIKATDATAEDMEGAILDEDGKNALAQVGRVVKYNATITVGKGAIGYVFHDKMGTGLELYTEDGYEISAEAVLPANSDYTLPNPFYTVKATPDSGDTITITFVDGLPEGTKITVTYYAKVTSDALTIDTGKNTARVNYGDSNSNNHTPDSSTNVYNAKLTIVKSDGSGNPVEGAGFVIKNSDDKYYYFIANPMSVEWVDTIDQATEHTSNASGVVDPFTGLVDGVYTLIEKTVPSGYNKAADYKFTIAQNSAETNLNVSTSVINNKGQELPSTGGIGTTIFYVVGAMLVLGSGVILVSKRRMSR